MRKFGLIGKKLGHSFSKKFFTEKFAKEDITDAQYELYELAEIDALKELLAQEPELMGLNVTVPYKEQVIPLLNELDEAAASVGAVNTIRISNGRTKGYNTDYIGFKESLEEFYPLEERIKALVLGTGGAAKAVWAALKALDISFTCVSRSPAENELSYETLTAELLQDYNLIVNTTPLGMLPNVDTAPPLPYHALTAKHYLYDLVYNPEETLFLKKGVEVGAKTVNGLPMLYRQAIAAWDIWNSSEQANALP
ncbi:shikimate dehydrogenase family protein [Pontibacter silvestris]|uniref:Shikimate dehydrogenase family protein n=1 Tax=Pontibacter silvestris TaxID=2305183 RepID=A0ABW4X2L7_9BACT|nr:shikimate dehydrogenase [Pontibacter silvestris]MCC9137038.1 shikimate dehydrogenase [Pontibacter silvestris]